MNLHVSDKKFICVSLFVLALVYAHFFINRTHVQIYLTTSDKTKLKIYWADKGQAFHEKRSEVVQIYKRKHEYGLYLCNLKSIEKLRIDPVEIPTTITIKSIIITQKGYKPIHFKTQNEFNRLIPVNDIFYSYKEDNELFIVSSGNDPQLEVHLSPETTNFNYLAEAIRLIAVSIFLIILFKYFKNLINDLNYVPLLMMFVAALIIAMAGISKNNRHPDEYVHVNAAVYYESHWAPPEICAPGTEKAYSVYGISRLNSYEITYLIAGKFSSIFRFLHIGKYYRLRLFNIFLFVILIIMNFRIVEFRLISIPLLISPQIWYVFSYFNSDAFAIFILFIVSYQVLIEKSMLRRYIRQEYDRKKSLTVGFLMGLLLANLLLLKKNFYIFDFFLVLYCLIKYFEEKPTFNRMTVKNMGIILIIGLSFFFLRHSVNIYTNGFDKKEKIMACREKLAKYEYKPSTSFEKRAPNLNLRSRGISLKDMFVKLKLQERSFRTAFGTYGYTSVYATNSYYHFIKMISILFSFFIGTSIILKGNGEDKLMLGNLLLCSFILIGGSFWASWTIDLQGQGRYLLPIAAMLGFLIFKSRGCFSMRILNGFIFTMFFISLYSFIFVGLCYIPKS